MRVLQVSWEYPPLIYGGLGRHVHGLAEAEAAAGHDVVVITQAHPQAPDDSVVNGVRVLRVTPDPPTLDLHEDLVAWTQALQSALLRAGLALGRRWRPDVIHIHDWVVAQAGVALRESLDVPLVATIHATEAGLWNGWITSALSLARHEVECWLAAQASHLIVCSRAMRHEVSVALDVPPDLLHIVPNGVDLDSWAPAGADALAARERWRIPPGAPLLVQAGRLEWEKGGHTSVAALARVRRRHRDARLVLAGRGSKAAELHAQARSLRVASAVRFPGHIDDAALAALLGAADVALVPSSYEPFGLVALEAMAAGTPVVAGDTGGLRDIIEHDVSGLLIPPHDIAALAEAVSALLADPDRGRKLAEAARRRVRDHFTWARIASDIEPIYVDAVRAPRPPRRRPPAPTYGNVFTGERTTPATGP